MLRMTPLASAIVALLIGIEAYAAEETFDTHFMIGGMKDQQVANIRLEDNQPLPGQYDIDIYVNKVPKSWLSGKRCGKAQTARMLA